MNDLPFSPVDMLVLALVADADLPAAAWDDIIVLLAPPPERRPDPAPGKEFAPVELPPAVHQSVMERVRQLAAQNPERKAEREQNPPPPAVQQQRDAVAAAAVRRLVGELPGFGCELRGELEDGWSR